jgi:hypothetical protein
MRRPRRDDGPPVDVSASTGAAVRTAGAVRPDQGRSYPTPSIVVTFHYDRDVAAAAEALLVLLRSGEARGAT